MPASAGPSRRSPAYWPVTALCLVYAAEVGSFFALRILLPEWPATLLLASYVAPFFFTPLLALVPLAFLSRSRMAQAGCLAVLSLFLLVYGPRFVPRLPGAPASTGKALTVMTFNLGPNRSQPAQLVSAIRAAGADVVAVQELFPAAGNALQDGLADRYPFTILPPAPGSTGLLSRCPIIQHEWFRPAGFGRTALRATLDVDGTPWTVFVVHPLPPHLSRCGTCRLPYRVDDGERERQVEDIAGRAAAVAGPVLIVGDLNMSEQSRAYDILAGRFGDAFREGGWGLGLTFPNGLQVGQLWVPLPFVRIDYIFHSADLRAAGSYVGCRGSSDHCYLVALLLRGPA